MLLGLGEMDRTGHHKKMCGPYGATQRRPFSGFPVTPWSGYTVRTLGSISFLGNDLFHLSWLASSFWVFPSVKWGESILLPPSLCCRCAGGQDGGCQLLGGRLPGRWARAGVRDRRLSLEVLPMEVQVPSSGVMQGKLRCGFPEPI